MERKLRLLSGQALLAVFFAAGTGITAAPLAAQEPNPMAQGQANPGVSQEDGIYLYRVKVVQRDLDAVNYFHRSGSTRIGIQGDDSAASGEGRGQGGERARGHHHQCEAPGADAGERLWGRSI